MTGLEWILAAILIAALIALSVIDLRTFRLPDSLTLPLIPAGFLAAWLTDQPVWLHVLGAAIGYGALVALEKGYETLRGRPGLGRGDAKLFAAGGAWCGLIALPLVLWVASISGLIWVLALRVVAAQDVRSDTLIAFGPFLSLGIAAVFIAKPFGLLGFFGI